ncbi:MAG: hypothetical protein OEZ02_08765, partial [Anaerolineae bacterium]|nr:hypothetical protein [Anaerolineae bacterium]
MKQPSTILRVMLMGVLLMQLLGAQSSGHAAQPAPTEAMLQAFLDQLTPEERVGQLFLVTFKGTDFSENSQIYDLIVKRHVGGVILQASNDNFKDAPDTITGAWEMIRGLQSAEYQGSRGFLIEPISGDSYTPEFIPLFIGISQQGDGYPQDQILSGLTQLPNAMALGATWQPDLARQVGEVLGRELSSLGFNLVLGPSLDVLTSKTPENLGEFGSGSFGGNAYWVGAMAQSWIEGVHTGSQNKIALAGSHFPGLGASDRPPAEEVPTVRKSLEQLIQVELAPFFKVAGGAKAAEPTVDALLLSHIHYQGFQDSIRPIPVSLDPQALGRLLDLEPLATWRSNGGIIISDELGSRGVRRFYDPTEQNFSGLVAKGVARDAFLAGNDVLYLGNFIADGESGSYTTIVSTLDFFANKYREDAAFASRVNDSVLRILSKKFGLYSSFTINSVLPNQENLAKINPSNEVSFEVSRQAATLLSPSPAALDNVQPTPPILGNQIVFFTDTFDIAQCSGCAAHPILEVNALQQAVLRLYGPNGAGQVFQHNLTSYSFQELEELLDGKIIKDSEGDEIPNPILSRLRNAQWIVFSMLDVDPTRPSSLALARLLSERPDLFQGKQLIVFAFNAPYYLDATDISKITAYYALYSKEAQFIDVAARLLFKELTPIAAPPISVPGIGYDLATALSPDPQQVIPLSISIVSEADEITEEATEEVDTPTGVRVGDRISIQTGVIVDHNRHPVPDDTPVRLIIDTTIEGVSNQREIQSSTQNGRAQSTLLIET